MSSLRPRPSASGGADQRAPRPSSARTVGTKGSAEPSPPDDDIVGDRDRLLAIGMTAVFAACVVFGGLRLAVELATGRQTPWWGNAAGAVAIALLRFWVRRAPKERSSVAVHGTALTATIALLVPAAYGMTSSKWWLSLVAFSVLLMGRRREAMVWTTATLVLLPLTALVEPYIVVPGAIGEPPFERSLAGLFFLVLLLGVTWAFRKVALERAKALTETAASLERANRVRSRFLAHMSHELRTPLHGVIAMADLAMRGDASPEVREQVATAQQSARVLLELLNNILDVTKADADAIELDEHPFALHALLTELCRPFEARARAKGLAFDATADDVVEGRVGDRVRVGQIVINLVSNALKFTNEGRISLRLQGVPEDAGRVRISVRDTGTGIPADSLSLVFEPFAQVAQTDRSIDKGAGLGLAIVRELARRMRGTVSVESELGAGSTFVVELSLPRAGTAFGPSDLLPHNPLEAADDPSPPLAEEGPLSILVCEDDPVSQRVALLMLKRLGHEVTVCDDGASAWDLLEAQRFDLLLTDVEMPDLDGVELTRRIRSRETSGARPRLPIIAATAHVGEDERHRLLDAGVDVHVPKPFTLQNLASALEHVAPRSAAEAPSASDRPAV